MTLRGEGRAGSARAGLSYYGSALTQPAETAEQSQQHQPSGGQQLAQPAQQRQRAWCTAKHIQAGHQVKRLVAGGKGRQLLGPAYPPMLTQTRSRRIRDLRASDLGKTQRSELCCDIAITRPAVE
eukprot:CAMPEP_0181215288 /NCGR_PEP_ID=MMETSP1096-20121128/25931_1 /TAXON_ID=156174 ORGANISM="Chrysochromulina ericina, Strain CCMP281" /NCGR_SAMPLE_ID=MMETSP1096 /ASSEMBLY_ACC=CAM_ASM_000453 /LENGTH=124 /DNA_ID=CAMNT_0023307129 /DNA_START=216 /DNA_END=591 /DNA_ORIENTATION=+